MEDTEDAATAAAKALACLRAVYPPYHPVRLAVFEQRIVRFLARIADMRAHGARVTSGSGLTDECPRSYRVASFPSLKRRRRRAAGRGNRMLPAVPRHSADLCGRGPPSHAEGAAGARFRQQMPGLMLGFLAQHSGSPSTHRTQSLNRTLSGSRTPHIILYTHDDAT